MSVFWAKYVTLAGFKYLGRYWRKWKTNIFFYFRPNILLLCLIWFFTPQSTIFQLCQDGSSWVEPVLKVRINVSCSRTQRSDTCEARTSNPSVSSQALYHWATALSFRPNMVNDLLFCNYPLWLDRIFLQIYLEQTVLSVKKQKNSIREDFLLGQIKTYLCLG